MRAGRLSESPDHAARRSVRVRGETGETDETEEVSGAVAPCTAMTAGPSAPPPPAPARARRVVDDRLRRTMRHVSMHHPQRFHHPRTGMRDNPETPHHAVE